MKRRIIHCGDYNNGPSFCGQDRNRDSQLFKSIGNIGDNDVIVGFRLFAKWVVECNFEYSELCEECVRSPDTALHVLRYLEIENSSENGS